MNRVPYASDIGSIAYAIIFTSFNFPNAYGIKREKRLQPDMTKVVKQLSRTI